MIRKLKTNDIDTTMSIWLETNIKTHSFIPQKYWLDNYAMIKTIFPQAEIYVYEDAATGQIYGFIGFTDNYIEGIFIEENNQSKGVGTSLLNTVKENRSNLKLNVYKKNTNAISFYKKNGFVITSENIDKNTGEKEYTMTWNK